ncbi:uncharacterized protein LOC116298694 [Actinia tenebrosa]|uniref:Uncharacterized protein LOC116298694 n=1 Tax=Actinia tenebrosa TaxID=6105 RepID=A0A6P8I583_ACTTE|nr:uncharacterized protein LOC116298694 [Actinia tenebrosa]
MTAAERIRYVRTVKIVSTDPSFQSRYNNLITLHREIFIGFRIHREEHFLTWHRWYILQYENLLRQVDCNVTVPYWDWTVVSGSPWGTTERDVWYSGNSGLGGNGVNPTYCVKDGPFRDGIWRLPPSNFLDSRCLKRNFTGNPPDVVALSILLNTPASLFQEFELSLRSTFHDTVHCLINGTMCSFDSSGAPEFFFHHAMVDKIWTDWQKKSNAHKEAYFKQLNLRLPSANGLRSVHLIDNQALPGGVRVLYAEINNPLMERTIKGLRSASPEILGKIPRRRFSGISDRAIKLFRLSKKEAAEAKRLEEKYQVDNEHLKPIGREEPVIEEKLGFDYHIVCNKDNYCNGKPNGNYPSPKTCQGYIACSNFFTYHMPCPADLYWNDEEKRCDWSQHANPGCHGMTKSVAFTPPRNFCTGKVDGDYPNPNDCYGFITCSNGSKYEKYCPALLMWNDVKKQCDWPSKASPPCQV